MQKAQAQRRDTTNVNTRTSRSQTQRQPNPNIIQRPPAPRPEDRPPPSEELGKRKWTIKRKLVQNTVSRYNYYFNAKKKLRGVTHNVSRTGQDNYNYLLPFYPYSVASLGISKSDLDSVVEKASINIQIHDPRSKWMDDSYLLIGEAYFFQGEWEKANRTFNYINTTYVPKKKKENKAVVGAATKDQITIASREKRKPPIGWFKHTYARNDAFVWKAKTLLEEGNFDEARSIVNILDLDPYFPRRLDGDLAEVKAYALYKQGKFSESIAPMHIAMSKKKNRDEKARMAYILGQLYTNYSQPDSAIDMYYKVIKTKPDQMMEFQARIAINKLKATMPGGSLEQSLATLKKMARREKYQDFRDAIYYTMAQLVEPTDKDAAMGYLNQSLKAGALGNNTMQRALTFKMIADINYGQRNYRPAKSYYDSTASVMPPEFQDSAIVNKRRKVLNDIAVRIEAIQLQDSLQRIAAMPESDRKIFLTKLAVKIRKEAEDKAKKDKADSIALAAAEAASGNNNSFAANMMNNQRGVSGPKADQGDWYFYNTASKASGYQEFKRKWGNRGNSDNWRRSQNALAVAKDNMDAAIDSANADGAVKKEVPADSTTAESLATNLPLTPDDLLKSNIIAEEAFYDLGKLYSDGLDNLDLGIETYDTLLNRYPHHPNKTEVIYSLYIWHNKLNHTALANTYKQQIMSNYSDSKFASILRFGGLQDANIEKKAEINAAYEQVYGAFKDCNYEGAYAMKKAADSTFGLNFMQPKFDLLEAMIIAKMDTCEFGKQALINVMAKYQNDDAVYARAKELMDALTNRPALVVYLSMLEIEKKPEPERLDEDVTMIYPWQRPDPEMTGDKLKTAIADSIRLAAEVAKLQIKPLPAPTMKPKVIYTLVAEHPHFVVMSFRKLTKAAVEKSLDQFTKYNKEHHADAKIQVGSYVMSQNEVLLIFRLFANEDRALDYFDEIRTGAEKIIPEMRPSDYNMFIISRDNFIQMNTRKDLEGYMKFFNDNYVTQ